MRKLISLLLLLTGCGETITVTQLPFSPPDWIKKDLIKACDKPDNADVWMELTEHHHFKCTNGYNRGDRVCYGWFVNAKAKCEVGRTDAIFTFDGVAFGNSKIHEKKE